MPNLRLITSDGATTAGVTGAGVASAGDAVVDERPRVSLRLLMAASGRCSCDECLLAYRAGNRRAGIIEVSRRPARLAAVR